MKLATNMTELLQNMTSCYQFKNVCMLQHGILVHNAYIELLSRLELEAEDPILNQIYQIIKPQLINTNLYKYHVFHDCGKHLSRIVDDVGKQHFPNHAELSAIQYQLIFPEDTDNIELIRRDMDMHTLRGEELQQCLRHKLSPILYMTAWAEIYANSTMFGGTDSISFKIKRKQLLKAGKHLLMILQGAST